MAKRTRTTPTWCGSISAKVMKWPWKGTTAGWCSSSSRWARIGAVGLQLDSECGIFEVLVYRPLRQPCSLLRTRQIFWGRSPRAGTSRRRSARTRFENSSSTSLLPLMLSMRCTAGWMLISTTKCDCLCRLSRGRLCDSPLPHCLGSRQEEGRAFEICSCFNLHLIVFNQHFSGLNYEINNISPLKMKNNWIFLSINNDIYIFRRCIWITHFHI